MFNLDACSKPLYEMLLVNVANVRKVTMCVLNREIEQCLQSCAVHGGPVFRLTPVNISVYILSVYAYIYARWRMFAGRIENGVSFSSNMCI